MIAITMNSIVDDAMRSLNILTELCSTKGKGIGCDIVIYLVARNISNEPYKFPNYPIS